MHDYFLHLWVMKIITIQELEVVTGDGYLTIEQFDEIINTPQIDGIEIV